MKKSITSWSLKSAILSSFAYVTSIPFSSYSFTHSQLPHLLSSSLKEQQQRIYQKTKTSNTMADVATERFLENATRIIWLFITLSSGYIVFIETVEIHGSFVQFVPVGFEDFPEVFGWAVILILIAFVTAQLDVASFEESIFTKVCRRCSIVSFALAVCLLFICRLLSSATLIGSVLAYEEL